LNVTWLIEDSFRKNVLEDYFTFTELWTRAAAAHIAEAAKRATAVWPPPGTWSRAAAAEAEKHELLR